jgi:hypothetical protein
VRKRLREITDEPLRLGFVFFGEQPDVVREGHEPLEQRLRLVAMAEQQVGIDQPERARKKYAFATRQPVELLPRTVSSHEPVVQQLFFDGADGPDEARIVGRQEADERYHEKTGVDGIRADVLDEGAARGVERCAADLVMNRLPAHSPALDGSVEPVLLHGLHGAIERHPRHDSRVRELATRPADLPDTLVRLAPDLLEILDERNLKLPRLRRACELAAPRDVKRVHELSPDVELSLIGSLVAHTRRLASRIPR